MKMWFGEHARVGLIVAIRNTQAGIEFYELDEIVDVSLTRQKRFFTRRSHGWGGNGFHFSGISARAPKGKTHAVIPDPVITELALQRVSWLYGQKSGKSPGLAQDKEFENRAREQYQRIFTDGTVESAQASAQEFV